MMDPSLVPEIKCEGVSPPGPLASAVACLDGLGLAPAVACLADGLGLASTPRTPEILNSLIAMTNPLDQYAYSDTHLSMPHSQSACDSSSSCSSIASPGPHTPHSVQKTCSELIKAGLKLSIESKRKMSGSECSESGGGGGGKRCKKEEGSDDEYDSAHTPGYKTDGLTPEDEERRRRRRERNKIAATKCRLKKRERTVNLVSESELLETQNVDLKTQLQELESQRQQLLDMLSVHTATCVRNAPAFVQPDYEFAPYEPASPYLRPESADLLASAYPPQQYYDCYGQRCQEFSDKPVGVDSGCLA